MYLGKLNSYFILTAMIKFDLLEYITEINAAYSEEMLNMHMVCIFVILLLYQRKKHISKK